MSYDDDFDDDQQDTDERDERPQRDSGDKPRWRRDLERKAKRADALERENAFLKAGVNPEDPKAKWLVKGYDGDLTPDAIKQAAREAGILSDAKAEEPKADAAKDELPADERDALERIEQTGQGGASGGARDFEAEIAAAQNPEQLMQILREAGTRLSSGAYVPPSDL